MSMTRPPYTSEFREWMVELVRSGRSPSTYTSRKPNDDTTIAMPTSTKPCYATSAKSPQLGKTLHLFRTTRRGHLAAARIHTCRIGGGILGSRARPY